MLLTTANPNDLEIRVPEGVKVIESYTSEFLINCIVLGPYLVPFMRHRLRHVQNRSILILLLRLTARRRGSPATISVKVCTEVRGWLKYTAAKKYCQKVQSL